MPDAPVPPDAPETVGGTDDATPTDAPGDAPADATTPEATTPEAEAAGSLADVAPATHPPEAPSINEVRQEMHEVVGQLRGEITKLRVQAADQQARGWGPPNTLLLVALGAALGAVAVPLVRRALRREPDTFSGRARKLSSEAQRLAADLASEVGRDFAEARKDLSDRAAKARREAQDVSERLAQQAEQLGTRAKALRQQAAREAQAAGARAKKLGDTARRRAEEATDAVERAAQDAAEAAKGQAETATSAGRRFLARSLSAVATAVIAKKVRDWVK